MSGRVERIRDCLQAQFSPAELQVIDESHQHAGHAGAASGRGHFRVQICAAVFAGMSPIQRHRAIYQALGTMMETDIHALAIEARAPVVA